MYILKTATNEVAIPEYDTEKTPTASQAYCLCKECHLIKFSHAFS